MSERGRHELLLAPARARRFGALVALLLVVLLAAPAPADARPAAAAAVPARGTPHQVDLTEGLRVESQTTYVVDLAGAVVRVEQVVTLTNEVPDTVSGGYIEQFYFHGYATLILAPAANLAATGPGGRSLGVTVEPVEEGVLDIATIDLAPNLFYGQTQTIRLTYDLPGRPPRSGGVSNVNRAFAAFPVLAVGDPSLATVEVVVPDGSTVESVGDWLPFAGPGEGVDRYRAENIADPVEWITDVIVRDDAQLAEKVVEYGEHTVRIQAWPDDPAWLDLTATLAAEGLPAIERMTGFGWDEPRELTIVETVAPYVYGYGGWYEHSRSLIEIGDSLDEFVTVHEMAHAWFNEQLFRGRWINEAFADEVAARALGDLGRTRPEPEPIDESSPVRVPLNDWVVPALDDPDSDAIETFGYNASWAVAHELFEEIGPEQMAEVLRAAAERRTPYPASTSDAGRAVAPDWRTLLDLLEEVGGSAEAERLFRDHVASPDQVEELDARSDARAAYGELVERGEGWAPPAALRDPMVDWDFDEAEELVPEVAALLDRRDDLADALEAIDEDLPDPLRDSFEGADDLDELGETMDAAVDAGSAVRDAVEARSDAGPIARVGLLFSDVDAEIDAARADLAAGDYADASSGAEDAGDQVDGATTLGLVRVGGVVVLAGLVVVAILVWRRRDRGDDVAEDPDDPADDGGVGHAMVASEVGS